MKSIYTVAKIEESFLDYPDFDSIATVIYFTGCNHKCVHCQNTQLNIPKTKDVIKHNDLLNKIVKFCQKLQTNKIVFLGGEPLQQKNILKLIESLKKYDICIYTGYDFINAINILNYHINFLKYLKVGKYNHNLKQIPKKNEPKREITLSSKNQIMYKITPAIIDKISIDGNVYLDKE